MTAVSVLMQDCCSSQHEDYDCDSLAVIFHGHDTGDFHPERACRRKSRPYPLRTKKSVLMPAVNDTQLCFLQKIKQAYSGMPLIASLVKLFTN